MNKARERNWSKARLSGITFNKTSFTSSELLLVKQIEDLRDTLLKEWDKNTEEHLVVVLKPYKCYMCGKRSNTEHIHSFPFLIIPVNLCSKCYFKEIQ